ncbi:hypothetical protein AAEU42_02210 [Pseudoflavonifractor phocaeensis]|uniref:hypothetical protein n=1 Tax=Pseudoflavonifractor phocaeensis TaxID=1870988 RepID=UPI00309028D1|nr:hypothetical protein CE91St43_09190 [Oscillospiraceae bacterium]
MTCAQAPALVWRTERTRPRLRAGDLLAAGLAGHPVLTLAAALLLTGAGMLAAVCLLTLSCVLPLGLLLGWY